MAAVRSFSSSPLALRAASTRSASGRLLLMLAPAVRSIGLAAAARRQERRAVTTGSRSAEESFFKDAFESVTAFRDEGVCRWSERRGLALAGSCTKPELSSDREKLIDAGPL